MSLRSRARSLSVVAILAAGGTGLIGSTQTWLVAHVAQEELAVPGASAVPVLQPLMLTALALGLVLSLVGPVLRHVLGALAVLLGAVVAWLVAPVAVAPGVTAVASAVTERTGIAGEGIADLVGRIDATPWPWVTLAASVILVGAGGFVLATARAWPRSGRRYDTDRASAAPAAASGPLDAVDSWDELSRGDDPTR
ncbi:Trp biosynthesis-associated membrane protein [Microbacterium album]|uniref:Peptidase n=1 Tax=Microbacterium album TaxID=2053191 RepID=A0A917ICX2_9MICO|nr:Trp biosynthesis-associated membrane protein [Microbacterium album]GGH35829.1 hypothetical protein GCM10010921_04530 [Microbacterium album]